MAKTRSQTRKITIKKEEEEEDCKDNLVSRSVRNTTKETNTIAKRRSSRNRNRPSPALQVKVEEDTDTKPLLKSLPKLPKRRQVSQEQINRLIDYVANHKMSVVEASCKANMSMHAGYTYYNSYKNDPEKKTPTPRNGLVCATPEHIQNLFKYIVDDKMTVKEASAKANMTYQSGKHFYNKYLKDSNHNIAIPHVYQNYTQEQQNEFIGYIVNDKMSITAAAEKAKMSASAGIICYYEYFTDQNPNIATPSHIRSYRRYTQEEMKEVISHIIDGKMSIRATSKKMNVSLPTATKYYRQYLKDNNMEIPVSKYRKHVTQDRMDEFISYLVDDKMTIKAASKKANMCVYTGRKYYRRYLKDNDIYAPALKERQTQLIGYIIDDNMSVFAASKKANLNFKTGKKYYLQYLKNQKCVAPTRLF